MTVASGSAVDEWGRVCCRAVHELAQMFIYTGGWHTLPTPAVTDSMCCFAGAGCAHPMYVQLMDRLMGAGLPTTMSKLTV